MKKFLNEFKEFALRGNVMDLAVGVIIGAAFQSIVKSLTGDVISPFIGVFAKTDFSNLIFTLNGAEIKYGAFITNVINFLITAFVIFLMVKAINKLQSLKKTKEVAEEIVEEATTKECPFCCSEISVKATRCPHCTSELDKS